MNGFEYILSLYCSKQGKAVRKSNDSGKSSLCQKHVGPLSAVDTVPVHVPVSKRTNRFIRRT